MSLLDSLKDVLSRYSNSSTQNTTNAAAHFDQVAQAAPPNVIAEGLAAVGVDVHSAGVITTPGVAYLTRAQRATQALFSSPCRSRIRS